MRYHVPLAFGERYTSVRNHRFIKKRIDHKARSAGIGERLERFSRRMDNRGSAKREDDNGDREWDSSPKGSKNPSAKLAIRWSQHEPLSGIQSHWEFCPLLPSRSLHFSSHPHFVRMQYVCAMSSVRPSVHFSHPPPRFIQFCGRARSNDRSTCLETRYTPNTSIWNLFHAEKKRRIDRAIWCVFNIAKICCPLSQARYLDNRKMANWQLF